MGLIKIPMTESGSNVGRALFTTDVLPSNSNYKPSKMTMEKKASFSEYS